MEVSRLQKLFSSSNSLKLLIQLAVNFVFLEKFVSEGWVKKELGEGRGEVEEEVEGD